GNQKTYFAGESAVLTAVPELGYVFAGWSGDGLGEDNPLTLLIDKDSVVGAIFKEDLSDTDGDGLSNYQELVVLKTNPNDPDSDADGYSDSQEQSEGTDPNDAVSLPTRMLAVLDLENGSVIGNGNFRLGSEINLTATPSAGYVFDGWSGDASGSVNPLIITIDDNKSIGATFTEDTRDPDGDGLSNYQEIVVIKTNPNNPDSDADGYNDRQEQIEETDPNDAASLPMRSLLFAIPTNGTVSGMGSFPLGVITEVSASPSPGYVFSEWVGDITGTDNPLSLTLDRNIIAFALFAQDQRDFDNDGLSNYLEIVRENTDPNNADSDGDGFNDGEEVSEGSDPNNANSFPDKTPIPLRIEKLQGQGLLIFAYWTGKAGKSYRVEYSADFQNWNTIDSGIVSEGIEQSRALPGPKGLVRIIEE
ncbi:InlB B-repeat-containing protein, partial [Akkermansiaceae bacterium]|nr:InlB B-repeat-containing protein [Akkermansiaceae bacterium]